MQTDNPIIVISEIIAKLEEKGFDPYTGGETGSISKMTEMATEVAANRITPYDVNTAVKTFIYLHGKFKSYYRTRFYNVMKSQRDG